MLRSGVKKFTRSSRVVARRPKANHTLPLSAVWNDFNAAGTTNNAWNVTSARYISSGNLSSWGDAGMMAGRGLNQDGTAVSKPWQAEGALDIQRVTQQAMVHELVQQQTDTIQKVVPWFLQNMPPAYFNQVPEKFRVDHIKAIAAIQGMLSTVSLCFAFS